MYMYGDYMALPRLPIEPTQGDTAFFDREDLFAQRGMMKAAWFTFWASITIGVASILLSLAVFSYSLKHNKLAQERNELELRPYLHTDITAINYETLTKFIHGDYSQGNPPKNVFYDLIITNHGQTPALKQSCKAVAVVSTYPMPDPSAVDLKNYVPLMHNVDSTGSLGPSAKIKFPIPLGGHFNDAALIGMRERRLAVYILGIVEYTDMFGGKHFTNFRYSHRPEKHSLSFNEDCEQHFDGNEIS